MSGHYLRGYAALFDVVNRWEDGQRPLMVRPGAFSLAGAAVPLCFGHDNRHVYASTRDGSLKVWQDGVGLAFEATPYGVQASLGLVQGIARRAYDRVSVCYAAGYGSAIERIGGEEVEVITWARIEEISICSAGACDPARVWHADHPVDTLDPGARALARKWALGRQIQLLASARTISCSGPSGRRRAPTLPASVAHFLSSATFEQASCHARQAAMVMDTRRKDGTQLHEAAAARPITGRSIVGTSGITCAADRGQLTTAALFCRGQTGAVL